ncbi:MAG: hypothetical protein E6J26_07495 [Chloroflexi bacterium]|nr:MAG: hypothetical protein E6J26_07495 [Chloroflexota bacterium]
MKSITQTTTVDGGGHITLTGGLATRLFNVSNGVTLTLRNIVLDQFAAAGADGGAIFSNGTLVLGNTTIQLSQTDINHSGGAIYSAGPVFISNSTLKKNMGGSAGAMFINNSNARAQVSNSVFNANQALNTTTGYGGAIWVGAQAKLTVVDGRFTGNSAQFGGALYVTQGGTATLSSQLSVDFEQMKFDDNLVTYGGAGCGGGGTCSAGGAIYSEGDLTINSVVFNHNQTPLITPLVGNGGAIASRGTLRMYNDEFIFNSARFGGALYVGPLAGAALGSVRTTIDATTFDLNSATVLGGALYTAGYTSVVTATQVVFHRNTASDGGGGVARYESNLRLVDSSFTDNHAATAGGGLYVASGGTDPGQVFVRSVTFSGNQTSGGNHGGGIANGFSGAFFPNGGVVSLNSVTVFSNTNGIFNAGLSVQTVLTNTVLSNPGSLNCDGAAFAVMSGGHNFSTDNSCVLNGPGDQKGAGLDAKLGPRQLEATFFHLPLPGSPLINAGANCPPRDQRGATRVGACDIGAVEFGGLLMRALLPLIRR